jgi:glycosyltransferase involved in cell wall biosynthesis
MKSPTVSVIMATYNHADFVQKSIQSVLMQQGVDFEFLIADDGSSDNTRDVVASICDKRIRFFPNQENRGACTVTNELIQQASGEFIALINSDDYWIGQDKLSYQLQVLRENPTVGACFGRARFIDKHDMPIPKTTLPFGSVFDQENQSQGKWLRYFFDYGNCICHPTILIRKECYDSVGMYDNRLRQLPDFDMWVRLVVHYPIYISDRELINFRIMPGENASSQTSTNRTRTINEHFLIAEKYFEKVTRDLLIDGFADLLVHEEVPTAEHLNIEKTLLFFSYNEWGLDKPYKMIGLLKLHRLLNDCKYREILAKDYGVDDRFFHQKMAELDVLLPKVITVGNATKPFGKVLPTILNFTPPIFLTFIRALLPPKMKSFILRILHRGAA